MNNKRHHFFLTHPVQGESKKTDTFVIQISREGVSFFLLTLYSKRIENGILTMCVIVLCLIKMCDLNDHSPINQNFDLNKSRQNSITA